MIMRGLNTDKVKHAAPNILYVLAVVLGGLVVATGIQEFPIVIAGLIFFSLFVIATLFHVRRLPKIFLISLGILLGIYAFLGRGGAYLGVPPLFVGEICLLLGLLTFVLSGGFKPLRKIPIVWLLIAFIFLGAIRTLPYLAEYGVTALRDAVIWGYAVFGLIVASCLLKTGWIERAALAYRAAIPWFLVWMPLAYMSERLPGLVPRLPISGIRIIDYKAGDMLVHLAGVAGFILVGLYYGLDRRRGQSPWFKEWALLLLWLIGFVLAATKSRGGMLAVGLALITLLVLRPTSRWGRVALLGVVLFSTGLLFNASFRSESSRQVSLKQFKENIVSIYSDNAEEGMVSTREWRLDWWGKIIGYTFRGPYFWTGKGFGMTLFTDISPGSEQAALRSPHNFHMTVLARMGVPGFALWVVLNALYTIGLLKAYLRARAAGHEFWAGLDVWLLVCWVAFVINASFDVYLEGPQGAVWFWSLFGMGIAALRVQGLHSVMQRGGGPVQYVGPPPREKLPVSD